ncbi:unnamed protein product, partial [Linum tenue]
MKQPLETIVQHDSRAESHPRPFYGFRHSIYHVGRRLEYVRPHIVEQVDQSVLATKPSNTQRHMLHSRSCSLPVNQVPVHKCILEQRRHSIDIVLPH